MHISYLFAIIGFGLVVHSQTCWENLTCTGPLDTAFPGHWEANIFAPNSRTVSPISILSLTNASVISSWPNSAHITGNGSALVFDFGKEVGGLATISYTAQGTGALGLAFSEAKNWIGLWSDSSNGRFQAGDGALYSNFTASGKYSYTMDKVHLRGGFRYLTLFLITNETASSIDINDISLKIGFQPTWSNLRAYSGYFDCSDDDLNKIWYSGAYTLQTNSVPVDTGRIFEASGWNNSGALANGSTVIVDGAKRDRAVWPGDMGIAVPATFVSIGDLDSVKNALQTMYDHQNKDWSFPEAGPPLLQQGSDTYHMWSMIGTYNYLLYTNDTAFLNKNWNRYSHAMEYIHNKVHQPSGLLNVTGRATLLASLRLIHLVLPISVLLSTNIAGILLTELSETTPQIHNCILKMPTVWLSTSASCLLHLHLPKASLPDSLTTGLPSVPKPPNYPTTSHPLSPPLRSKPISSPAKANAP
jgi:hypothetical protein